jgi:tol-pal system protein YbgF
MPRLGWLCPMFAFWTACAAGAGQTKSAARADERLAELARSQAEQAGRIAELEARLRLLEADARQGRSAAGSGARSSETVRIGAASARALTSGADPDAGMSTEAEEVGEQRPALLLRGRARAGSEPEARRELPPLPVAHESLPVVPLPAADRARRESGSAPAAVSDSATSNYRAALRLLRERRFDDAALALSNWLADNPDHALLDKALYWRAEARYAKRDYRQALAEFETVIERFPGSEKAPDSLFKIGMCLLHLGSERKARDYFRRVQEQYPNSEAASLASREESS